MRTVTAREVAYKGLRKAGQDPATVPAETLREVFEQMDEAVREGWDAAAWPELCPLEERARRDLYRADRQYYANDEVYYPDEEAYYRCIATTLGNLPTDTDFWEPITAERWMAKAQDGKPVMDMVIDLRERDPRDCPDTPHVSFEDRGDYIWVQSSRNTLWVQYRLAAPSFAYVPVVGGETYPADSVVYNAADGECYMALVSATGAELGDPEKWERQPLPLILRDFVASRIAASLKSSDEQHAVAAKFRAEAEAALEREMDKFLFVPAGGENQRPMKGGRNG